MLANNQSPTKPDTPPSSLRDRILDFRAKRHWQQFHTPKNLALSISLEAAELLENFQWTDPKPTELTPEERERIEQEAADIAIYLTLFCHDLGIDLEAAMDRKLKLNEIRYPAHLSKGTATKYTRLPTNAPPKKIQRPPASAS